MAASENGIVCSNANQIYMMANILKDMLSLALTKGLPLDDPSINQLRRNIIQEKSFLRKIYQEWYESIAEILPAGDEPVLELGSGAGFLCDYIPGLVTSEVYFCTGLSAVLDAQYLPMSDKSLRAIVMTDVLHHIPKTRRFFVEASRCIRDHGKVIMIEPWVTPWSRLIYSKLHHEPFLPDADKWEFPSDGPLSGANGALPWILFERDRAKFQREFPQWRLQVVKPIMPFRYLVSGGVSLRSLMPGQAFGLWRGIERALQPWSKIMAMFAQIVLVKKGS